MKTLSIALVAATLVAGSVPAFAGNDSDSPTFKEQMTNLYVTTGDATYARLAGLTEQQLAEQKHMRPERQDLD